MEKSNITLDKKNSILSIEQTTEFVEQINSACLEVNIEKLKTIISKFNLLNKLDIEDFISQGKYMFKQYDNPLNGCFVLNTNSFPSKCVACSFGKTVTIYEINYIKHEDGINLKYYGTFGLNIIIENNMLLDFSWCNAYLNKNEILKI